MGGPSDGCQLINQSINQLINLLIVDSVEWMVHQMNRLRGIDSFDSQRSMVNALWSPSFLRSFVPSSLPRFPPSLLCVIPTCASVSYLLTYTLACLSGDHVQAHDHEPPGDNELIN